MKIRVLNNWKYKRHFSNFIFINKGRMGWAEYGKWINVGLFGMILFFQYGKGDLPKQNRA